jgi:hypothetical protein
MLNPTNPTQLATEPPPDRVDFDRLPSKRILQSLDTHLCKHPDTLVRFFSNAGDWTSLDFLRHLPHVRRLSLQNTDIHSPIVSLAPLTDVLALELLNVTSIANRKFDFTPLLDFTDSLDDLSIWIEQRVHSNYFDSVRQLTGLTSFGTPFADFQKISTLRQIRFLNLGAGPFSNTDCIAAFRNLNRVRCFRSRLDNLDVLFGQKKLKTVELLHMPNQGVARLPDRSTVEFLYIDGFKSIETFESLTTYTRLKTLVIRHCHLPPSHFAFLSDCVNLKRVFVEYPSKKRRDEFAAYVPNDKLLTKPVFPGEQAK